MKWGMHEGTTGINYSDNVFSKLMAPWQPLGARGSINCSDFLSVPSSTLGWSEDPEYGTSGKQPKKKASSRSSLPLTDEGLFLPFSRHKTLSHPRGEMRSHNVCYSFSSDQQSDSIYAVPQLSCHIQNILVCRNWYAVEHICSMFLPFLFRPKHAEVCRLQSTTNNESWMTSLTREIEQHGMYFWQETRRTVFFFYRPSFGVYHEEHIFKPHIGQYPASPIFNFI